MNRKLKVLQVCAVGFTAEKFLLPLIDEMNREYEVAIVCGRDSFFDNLRNAGYSITNIDIGRKIAPFKNIAAVFKLYSFIKKGKFDIVHVHTPLAGILGRVAARLAGVPIVVYTAHGFYFHDNMPWYKKNLFILIEKLGGLLSDFVFSQSAEDCKTAIERKIVRPGRILTIGNGVDIARFSRQKVFEKKARDRIRGEFNISDDEIVVGIVGRVVREKGYLEFVMAANEIVKRYEKVKFVAVGDTIGSDRDSIKDELSDFISKNRLGGRIIFTGTRTDIPELLSVFDIFALPSYREGMPRSLIEAMCMSLPAVATDIRGCREEVVEGVTGYLVPVRDYKSLAEKIAYLVEHPETRLEMGKKAREKAEKEFDERLVIQKQLDIIKKLIAEKIRQKPDNRRMDN